MERDTVLGLEWTHEVGADHIGDGVYVRPVGDGIVLRTDRDTGHHVIWLDRYTMEALERFIKRTKEANDDVSTS